MSSKKKNLIIFSYDFPPMNGGIARLCLEIAAGIKPYYKSVIVLTRKKQGLNIPYNLKEVEVVNLPQRRLLTELYALLYLFRLKKKNNYDIICGNWHPEASLSIISGFKSTFVLGHGAEFRSGISKFRKTIWLPYYAKFVLNNVKLIIANSNYTKKLVHSVTKSANCVVLPLGVNQNFFKPILNEETQNNILKICTVSRIEKFKGHDFIANVLAKMPKVYLNRIEWNIAGTGDYLEELIKIIHQLGIQDMVKFYGFVKDIDLPAFYNDNDIFVLCTRENQNDNNVEGFGLVFLEAQSSGIPVIGTNSGGIPDAIKEKNGGWLIEEDNEAELYDLLVGFLKDKSIVNSEGLKARKRVENRCTWEIYFRNLSRVMES
jgi:phosphatidylinositol alpha-1,6-mannosyltransferase